MPAQNRKKNTPAMAVPEPGDSDRKRVLNVLAQRRYRQRKREKQQELETRLRAIESGSSTSGNTSSVSPASNVVGSPNLELFDSQFTTVLFGPEPPPHQTIENTSNSSNSQSHSPDNASSGLESTLVDENGFIDDRLFSTDDLVGFDSSFDSSLVPFNDQPLFPTTTSLTASNFMKDVTTALQDHQTATFTFPDDPTFYHPELAMMRAGFGIASRLGIDIDILWNLHALHTMPITPVTAALPPNLRPTALQQQVPHHPFIDILPWPAARDKLIAVLSQPSSMRPPAARDADGGDGMGSAMVKLSFDMEDMTRGCRVWGEDFCDEKNWEVGEEMFQHWWWALDRKIVERSNQLRQLRGEDKLRVREIE